MEFHKITEFKIDCLAYVSVSGDLPLNRVNQVVEPELALPLVLAVVWDQQQEYQSVQDWESAVLMNQEKE
jgi:hypothetical protein